MHKNGRKVSVKRIVSVILAAAVLMLALAGCAQRLK